MVDCIQNGDVNVRIIDHHILDLIEKIARSSVPVLIIGETGTGKEVITDLIIAKSGHKMIQKVNCSAIPESLLESELFGHEKGAFTGAYTNKIGRFEQANGGTLFLDEIGDMNPGLQTKLLRVLQDGTFRRVGGTRDITCKVRLIAATNKDLQQQVKLNNFRIDLYYRLNVITLKIPALRGRHDDILELANFFLGKFIIEYEKNVKNFTKESLAILFNHGWSGNIRELKNVIERAVLISGDSNLIESEHFLLHDIGEDQDDTLLSFTSLNLKNAEKEFILKALKIRNWSQTNAAKILGITSRVLNYKIIQHNIVHPSWKVYKSEKMLLND